ncbi:hypothetical protein Tco_0888868 [Tanacetum coccineum]
MTHSNPRRNMIPQAVLMRSGIKAVNTAKPKGAYNVVNRNLFHDVKASACWIQDYALWEVIENGNSWVPIPVTAPESRPSTVLKMTVPSTATEKICKKNDVKVRSLLLMALPNEHQLTFNQYVDAQSMFAAIKARFGENEATKRTQKALLKQQYENFNASSSESLDSIFNRF